MFSDGENNGILRNTNDNNSKYSLPSKSMSTHKACVTYSHSPLQPQPMHSMDPPKSPNVQSVPCHQTHSTDTQTPRPMLIPSSSLGTLPWLSHAPLLFPFPLADLLRLPLYPPRCRSPQEMCLCLARIPAPLPVIESTLHIPSVRGKSGQERGDVNLPSLGRARLCVNRWG